ncbi:DNA polymerase [Methylobacterium sp. J-076]|uniref:DNA polymerase n=1 Tax=Methylobacterium sp. J-076 TaxID=2836655 RepID=UPI001FB8DA5E|nr:DNA polymerase [Methylobacterium sp. J-076]MCJ2015182.1 DNA polymerase [Methylobacterium sp. J-076]
MTEIKEKTARRKTSVGDIDTATPPGGRSSLKTRLRASSKPFIAPPIHIACGIDAEWVTRVDAVSGKPYNQILSYQLVLDHNGQRIELIRYTNGKTRRHRLTLERLLELGIRKAIKEGVLPDWPNRITVFCHFLRADITAFDNFWPRKREFDGFGRTFTAASVRYDLDLAPEDAEPSKRKSGEGRRSSMSLWAGGRGRAPRRVSVRFVDTMLLTPGRGSLDTAAKLIGSKKGVLPDGYRIDRMDELLAGDRKEFEAYALQDARIALNYGLELQWIADEMGLKRLPSSLAGFAVAIARQEIQGTGLSMEQAFSFETVKQTVYSAVTGKLRTRVERQSHFSRQVFDELAALGYHGGRNEAYTFGPTETGMFYDLDLPGAYTTAMCLLKPLDYANAYMSQRLVDYEPDVMGVAQVRFAFPPGTRHPSLPVRNDSGLLFPLEGVSVCTAPEISAAKNQGAQLDILLGVIIPWASNIPIFESFTHRIQTQRREAGNDSMRGLLLKEIGNSLYGKTAQGVHPKRAFDPRLGRMDTMPPSVITSPWFAAFVSGFVRALLGEILAGVPKDRTVVSATTDGFLTDAPLEELRLDGALYRIFRDVRERLFPNDNGSPLGPKDILVEKHVVGQVISMRTRGQVTCEFLPGKPKPVLAKAGVKPNAPRDQHNDYMLRLFLNRTPGQQHIQTSLISLQEQWHTESDLVGVTKNPRLSLEYDFKRRPVKPVERAVQGRMHLAFDSVPWRNVEEAREAIVRFKSWSRGQGRPEDEAYVPGRLLKTLPDFLAWQAYHTMSVPVRAAGVGLRGDGPLGHLYRQFLRALVRGEWGLSLVDPTTGLRSTYGEISHWLVTIGFPDACVDDLKNAKRSTAKLAPQTVYLNEDVARLLRAILEQYPIFNLDQAMHPDHLAEAQSLFS